MKYFLNRAIVLVGLIAGLAAARSASAATILGQVSFTGTATFNGPLSTATAVTAFTNVQVEAGTGDYAVPSLVPLNTSVTIAALTFDPLPGPVAPLWTFTVGGTEYSFELTTMAVARMTMGANHFLSLSGTGIARATGFEDTTGDFTLSAQQAVNASGTTVTFSSEAVVANVPEPGVAGLAAAALLVPFLRRRRPGREAV
jgi:hypothetical protein